VFDQIGDVSYVPKERRFLQYDQSFGLPLGGFINASVGKDSEGRLYFGMQEGMYISTSSHNPVQFTNLALSISRFIVFRSGESGTQVDKYPSPTKAIELNYDENSFRIELAVMDFAQTVWSSLAINCKGLIMTGFFWETRPTSIFVIYPTVNMSC
jgi:hypothetical protein